MEFNWEQFKEKWIWRTYKPQAYRDVDDMLACIKKRALVEGIYYKIYYTLKRLWEAPGDYLREQKWRKQRADRGWSDRDAWGAYSYLAKVIKETTVYIRKHKHGVPMGAFAKDCQVDETGNPTDEATEEADKNWGEILDNIAYTFDMVDKIEEHDILAPHGKKYFTKKEFYRNQKFCNDMNKKPYNNMRVMTLEEFKKYNKGWELFREHFFSLWD